MACNRDIFTVTFTHLLAVCLSNVGALTSRNPMGLHGLKQGYLYLLLLEIATFRDAS
jgi:hypothetical protein